MIGKVPKSAVIGMDSGFGHKQKEERDREKERKRKNIRPGIERNEEKEKES